MITTKHLSQMFPDYPALPLTFLGTPECQGATEDEIVGNIYKQRDLKNFLPFAITKLTEAEAAKRQTWRCQHLLQKLRRHPLYKENAPQGAFEVPDLFTRTRDEEYGTFPHENLLLPQMSQRANELSARGYYEAAQILDTMKDDVKKDPRIPKDYEGNRTGRHLSVKISMNDVHTPYQLYRLGGCPKTIQETSALVQTVLEAHDRVFVSAHDIGEHQEDRNVDFWENAKLRLLQVPGWTLVKERERELIRLPSVQDPQKITSIVESTLLATKDDGTEKRELTHLHFRGWPDASPLPSERVFDVLQQRLAELCPSPEDRMILNCIGGVGRTGTMAVARYCKQFVDAQVRQNIKLEDIRLNIPEIIYLFRGQRHGIVGQYSHLVHLYAYVGRYYDELKAKRDAVATTTTTTTTTTC